MTKLAALISTICIGLLACSAVGVAAQEDETVAPVEFTAKLAFGPSVRSETTTVGDGVTMYSGGAWRAGVITEAGSGSRSHDQNNDAPGGTNGGDGKSVSASGGNGWNTVMNNPAGNAACRSL